MSILDKALLINLILAISLTGLHVEFNRQSKEFKLNFGRAFLCAKAYVYLSVATIPIHLVFLIASLS